MKRWAWIVLGVVVLLCGGGAVMLNGFRQQQLASAAGKVSDSATVDRGEVLVQVVESGTIDAARVVELKSRAAGRLARLLRDEGDVVAAGELIAVIDPTETRLQVDQNSAQLRGAMASVARQDIEIRQRRVLSVTALQRAKDRLAQLERENRVQPTLTRSSIDGAQAALMTAQKQRELLVSTTQPNERTNVKAELDQATLNLENAEVELKRLEGLLSQEFVSLREVEAQRLQVGLAKSRRDAASLRSSRLAAQQLNELRQSDERVRQAQADLARAKANTVQDTSKSSEVTQARLAVREAEAQLADVDALIASRAQGQASVDQLQSTLSDSRRQLGETEIKAPYAGVITKRLMQEGELVSSLSSFSSGTPIVRLEDRSKMLVKLNINEIDVAKLKLGMTASILIDALPTKTYAGEVTKIAPAKIATASSGGDSVVRFEVEVKLDNPDGEIKSGMTAKCTMNVVDLKDVVRVPVDYVIKEGNDRFVMVLPEKPKRDDAGTKTKITVGAESASFIQVLSGLKEGQKLKRPGFAGPGRNGSSVTVGA